MCVVHTMCSFLQTEVCVCDADSRGLDLHTGNALALWQRSLLMAAWRAARSRSPGQSFDTFSESLEREIVQVFGLGREVTELDLCLWYIFLLKC